MWPIVITILLNYLAEKPFISWHKVFGPHVFQIPFEPFALEAVFKLQPRSYLLFIAILFRFCEYQKRAAVKPEDFDAMCLLTGVEFEVKLLPLVHPNQRHSCQVRIQNVRHAAGECVGRRFPKYVSDMRTRCYFNAATALPDLCIDDNNNLQWL